jgi:hypothetical protein
MSNWWSAFRLVYHFDFGKTNVSIGFMRGNQEWYQKREALCECYSGANEEERSWQVCFLACM